MSYHLNMGGISFYTVLAVPVGELLNVAVVKAVVVMEMAMTVAVVEKATKNMAMEKIAAEGMAVKGMETKDLLCYVQPCLYQSGLVVYGT